MQNEQHDMQHEERKQKIEEKRVRANYMREYRKYQKKVYKEAREDWECVLASFIEEVNPKIAPELYVLLLELKNRNYIILNRLLLHGNIDEKFNMLYKTLHDYNPVFFGNSKIMDEFISSYYDYRNDHHDELY